MKMSGNPGVCNASMRKVRINAKTGKYVVRAEDLPRAQAAMRAKANEARRI